MVASHPWTWGCKFSNYERIMKENIISTIILYHNLINKTINGIYNTKIDINYQNYDIIHDSQIKNITRYAKIMIKS